MNATLTRININRTNAKRLRSSGFYAEADAYDATADELRDEMTEMDRRRIAAKHAAVNPLDPPFDLRPGYIPIADGDGAVSAAHALADEMVAKYDAAQAANQGEIDDALEAEHDARDDWRHCKSGD